MITYEFHDVANIFPMMNEQEYKDLLASIKENGQREPIVIYENKVIDGRNRYTACIELQIEPIVKQWDGNGSLLDFVRDMNFNRRQLDTSQRAMVAARMKPLYTKEAEERQKATQLAGRDSEGNPIVASVSPKWDAPKTCETKGRTDDIVGEKMGVSRQSVVRATKVLTKGTEELQKAVDNGIITVNKAAEIAGLPKAQQQVVVEQTKAGIKPTKEKLEDIAKENAEYIAANTTEMTEDDLEVQVMVEELTALIGNSIAKIETKICSMKSIKGIYGDITVLTSAFSKCIEDIESLTKSKIKMERENN